MRSSRSRSRPSRPPPGPAVPDEVARADGGEVEIGRVARPHGIRGEVRVHLHNRDSDALETLETLDARRPAADGGETDFALTIEAARRMPDRSWIVLFAGISSRNDAETLRGVVLSADRSRLAPPDDDELYAADLVDLEAVAPDGRSLGRVRSVYDNGAQQVLVVATPDGDVDVPYVDAFVAGVDLEARRVVIVDLDCLIPGKA